MTRAAVSCAISSLLLTAAAPVQSLPQAATPDPHIQTVSYDEGHIVPLRVAPGFVASVAFAPDERIEAVAVGDPGSWQITANKQGDHLFIRALQDGGTTNAEVVTDARHYTFLLSTGSAGDPTTTFSLRFDYGGSVGHTAPAPATLPPGIYRLTGDRRARPATMADDGRVTRLCWPDRAPIPVIFARDASGGERLANSRIEAGCAVIDAVWPGYRFVIDTAVARAERRTAAR